MSPFLFARYFQWHYSRGVSDMFGVWATAIWFPWYWCAVGFHARHLFSRFNRLGEAYPGTGFHLGELLGSFIINLLMRVIGALVRIGVIVLGILLSVGAIFVGGLAFLVWLLLPIIAVSSVIIGVVSMFSL